MSLIDIKYRCESCEELVNDLVTCDECEESICENCIYGKTSESCYCEACSLDLWAEPEKHPDAI